VPCCVHAGHPSKRQRTTPTSNNAFGSAATDNGGAHAIVPTTVGHSGVEEGGPNGTRPPRGSRGWWNVVTQSAASILHGTEPPSRINSKVKSGMSVDTNESMYGDFDELPRCVVVEIPDAGSVLIQDFPNMHPLQSVPLGVLLESPDVDLSLGEKLLVRQRGRF